MTETPTDGEQGAAPVRRVLLVDDHPILRRGLRQLLEQEPGWAVCGEAGTPDEALALIDTGNAPDVIVVDMSLDGASGLELLRALHARGSTARILVLSMHDEDLYAERALRAGAHGYVMKQAPPDTFLQALRTVADGGHYLSPRLSARLFGKLVGVSPSRRGLGIERLSNRELEVFELIGRGSATRVIATRLGISVKTVEAHKAHIKQRLGLVRGQDVLQHAIRWVEQRD